jgi:hypothetical protein
VFVIGFSSGVVPVEITATL